MARTETPLQVLKVPAKKDLPEGLEIIQAERKVDGPADKDGKATEGAKVLISRIAPVVGPKAAVGIRNFIKLLSEMVKEAGNKGDDGNVVEDAGVQDVANMIRAAVLEIATRFDTSTAKDSLTYYLPYSGPRLVDPYEAQTVRITTFQREHGRMPNPTEYAEMFADLIG